MLPDPTSRGRPENFTDARRARRSCGCGKTKSSPNNSKIRVLASVRMVLDRNQAAAARDHSIKHPWRSCAVGDSTGRLDFEPLPLVSWENPSKYSKDAYGGDHIIPVRFLPRRDAGSPKKCLQSSAEMPHPIPTPACFPPVVGRLSSRRLALTIFASSPVRDRGGIRSGYIRPGQVCHK